MRRMLSLAMLVVGASVTNAWAEAACPSLPYNLANGQAADASQVMANFNALATCPNSGPAGATNSLQYNAGSGGFGAVGPLGNGQLVVGSTGNLPQAGTITAGSGISVTNGPGSITIAATGGENSIQRELGPFAPPTAASFTFIDTPNSITPTVTDTPNVGLVYSVPVTTDTGSIPGAYRAVPPTTPWTLTFRAKYSTPPGNYPEFGVLLKDSSGKMLAEVLESSAFIIKRFNSNTSFNSNPYSSNVLEAPAWFRVHYDGTTITFSASWDGQNWLQTYAESSTTFLNGNLQLIGIGGLTGINNHSLWVAGSTAGAVLTYWDIDDDPASNRTTH